MPALPSPVPKWQLRRQRLLHGLCRTIAADRQKGKSAAGSLKKAAWRWNRSKLAQSRERHLGASGMGRLYSLWKLNPSPEVFAPIWKSNAPRKITPEQAATWARRAIVERITITTLYRLLKAEGFPVNFSRATFHRVLPGRAIRAVCRAQANLEKAERAALAKLDARARSGA